MIGLFLACRHLGKRGRSGCSNCPRLTLTEWNESTLMLEGSGDQGMQEFTNYTQIGQEKLYSALVTEGNWCTYRRYPECMEPYRKGRSEGPRDSGYEVSVSWFVVCQGSVKTTKLVLSQNAYGYGLMAKNISPIGMILCITSIKTKALMCILSRRCGMREEAEVFENTLRG